MTLRPRLTCGEPADAPRCPEHTIDTKPPAADRGYDSAWTKLSKRARRLQPFCTDCGSTERLEADHTPEAWTRKAAGKAIRLSDIRVLCGTLQPRCRSRTRAVSDQGDVPRAPKL